MNNKLFSYFGFATRSRNIIFGIDNILRAKNLELVIIDPIVSSDTARKVTNYCSIHNTDCLTLSNLSTYLSRDGVKVVGILDKNMALAIKGQIVENK